MTELGYVPNAAARSLITRRTGLLGLIVSNITNAFYPELVEAISRRALAAGYTVIVGSTDEGVQKRDTKGHLVLLTRCGPQPYCTRNGLKDAGAIRSGTLM